MVGLYSELFYANMPPCFPIFCCSAIPTSHQTFNVFQSCNNYTLLWMDGRVQWK